MIPATGDDYTDAPVKARIWTDGSGEWFLDGVDETGNYTEACWSYDYWENAVAALPEFWAIHIAKEI